MAAAFGAGPRGFVGQEMSGRKSYQGQRLTVLSITDVTTASSGTITAPNSCHALIYAVGGGGNGGADAVNAYAAGGGGGAALYKMARIAKGQRIAYSVGVAADTTVTLPTGIVLTARKGSDGAGGSATLPASAGGVATGGDINRTGGTGGAVVATAGSSGTAGANGGAGGTSVSQSSGGGGAAGFSDIGVILGGAGGNGNNSGAGVAGAFPGGGGGGGLTGGGGERGRVFIMLVKIS